MIPDKSNVYGTVSAPNGLAPLLRAVKSAFNDGRAYVSRSQFSGVETLRLRSDEVDMDTDPLGNGSEHLFNGAVGGTATHIIRFIERLSAAMSADGLKHHFEIYGPDESRVKEIPFERSPEKAS